MACFSHVIYRIHNGRRTEPRDTSCPRKEWRVCMAAWTSAASLKPWLFAMMVAPYTVVSFFCHSSKFFFFFFKLNYMMCVCDQFGVLNAGCWILIGLLGHLWCTCKPGCAWKFLVFLISYSSLSFSNLAGEMQLNVWCKTGLFFFFFCLAGCKYKLTHCSRLCAWQWLSPFPLGGLNIAWC